LRQQTERPLVLRNTTFVHAFDRAGEVLEASMSFDELISDPVFSIGAAGALILVIFYSLPI
jgi:hypothetical protein